MFCKNFVIYIVKLNLTRSVTHLKSLMIEDISKLSSTFSESFPYGSDSSTTPPPHTVCQKWAKSGQYFP